MNILAAKDTVEVINLVIAFVFALVFVLAKLGEKWLQRRVEQKAQLDRQRQEASGQAMAGEEADTHLRADAQSLEQQRLRRYPPTAQRPATVGGPSRLRALRPARPHQVRPHPQVTYRQVFQPGPQKAALRRPEEPPSIQPPQPIRLASPEVAAVTPVVKPFSHTGVEDEIARLKSRLRDLDLFRQKRLAELEPVEGDTAAIEARLLRVQPVQDAEDAEDAGAALPSTIMNLSRLADARNAIIFYEVLSAPKSLRQERQMWDVY